MAKWAKIKCERCAENDALWEGMERLLEESDAREARLEARIKELEAKLAKAVDALQKMDVGEGWAAQIARDTLAELTGGKDE